MTLLSKLGINVNSHQAARLIKFAFTPHIAIMLLGALVGILLISSVLYLGVLIPNNLKTTSFSNKLHAGQAAKLIDYSFNNFQHRIASLANHPNAIAALSSKDTAAIDNITNQLAQSFPEATLALAIPVGLVDTPELGKAIGFAPVDLVHRSEQNLATKPEASKKDDTWMVYFVAPVKEASGARTGTLLIGIPTKALTKIWSDLDNNSGKFSLFQNKTPVISQGNGSGNGEMIALAYADLTVKFQPAGDGETDKGSLGFTLLIAAMLGAILFNIVAIFISEMILQKQMRDDSAHLLKFIHAILNDNPAVLPSIKHNLLNTLAQSVEHYSRLASKNKTAAAVVATAAKIKTKPPTAKAAQEPAKFESEADDIKPKAQTNTESQNEILETPASTEESLPTDPVFEHEEEVLDLDIMSELDDIFGNTIDPDGQSSDVTTEDDTLDIDAFNDPASEQPIAKVSNEIFRAYDIRGIVDETLTDEVVNLIGLAIGTEAITRGERAILVGYDGRLSSPQLNTVLCNAIAKTGCHVTSIGQVSTPVLYFATATQETHSGVMITGSHNPANYNGFKIVLAGNTLSGEDIQALYDRIQANKFSTGDGEIVELTGMNDRYVNHIIKDIKLERRLKVVVDCGNGAAGLTAPQTLAGIDCDVIPLFCDVDGHFPNHHPDPSNPKNLEDLIAKVKSENADIGIAFDGDGDRLGVVTNTGEIIYPDRVLAVLAKSVLTRKAGGSIIFDVKCSRILPQAIREAGGIPIMWKTGHSFIKAKLKETGALLAGEMSGHIFFNDRWFGFDDGLYSAARLLEVLAGRQMSAQEAFDSLPATISTPEINVSVSEDKKFAIIESLVSHDVFDDDEAKVSTIDGVRVDYRNGWGLVRASNTTPCLVLRFEADTEEVLERIKALFKEKLLSVDSSLALPF